MFGKLLEKIRRVVDEEVEFIVEPSRRSSVIDYSVEVDGEPAGIYTIEPRETSVHIIGAVVDPEFRGQGITKQFIELIVNEYSPNYLTTSSQRSAIPFWRKMGFKQIRKEEYGGTHMLRWV